MQPTPRPKPAQPKPARPAQPKPAQPKPAQPMAAQPTPARPVRPSAPQGSGPKRSAPQGSAPQGSAGRPVASAPAAPQGPRPHPRLDPLSGVDHIVVDGSNLLHALRKGGLPAPALIGRLRAIIPAAISVELVFDGVPDRGMRRERVASGLMVTYSWPRSGDAAIMDRLAGLDADAADHLLVVTDDRDLRSLLTYRGARTARSSWLLSRLNLERNAAPTAGNPRGPAAPPVGSGAGRRLEVDKDEDPGPGWAPGRGATSKTGNGRKPPRNAARAGRRPPV